MIDTNVVCDYCGQRIRGNYMGIEIRDCSPIRDAQSARGFRGEFCNKKCFLMYITSGWDMI